MRIKLEKFAMFFEQETNIVDFPRLEDREWGKIATGGSMAMIPGLGFSTSSAGSGHAV